MGIIFCYILKIFLYPIFIFTLLMPQTVESLPAVWKTRVRSLGREDPLEKEMAPTPVFLPGKSRGQRSLAGYSLWDANNRTHLSDWAHWTYMLLLLFSCKVVSDSLQPHELQHARLPCPSLSPGICSNSCPLSQWCHPTILSSVVPFSSCPQSFPASGFFPCLY